MFRCLQSKYCKARISIADKFENPKIKREHSGDHFANFGLCQAKETLSVIKDRVRNEPGVSVPSIYASEVAKLAPNESAAANMPTLQQVDSSLDKERRKMLPALPQSRQDIVFPEAMITTMNSEPFLLHAAEANEVLIFSSQSDFVHLCSQETVYIDGTFDAVPQLYAQLFTIHAFVDGNRQIRLVYCILPSKTRDMYTQVFRVL